MLRFFKKYGFINTIREIRGRILGFIYFRRIDIKIDSGACIRGRAGIKIGRKFSAGKYLKLECIKKYENMYYDSAIVIKDNVIFHDFIHIGATNYIEIGNNVLMASKIYISDHNHGYYKGDMQSSPLEPPIFRIVTNDSKVIIEDNVWIGEMVSILPGVCIGTGSIIGANSVVTNNIPSFSIAVGNPAKVIKQFNFNSQKWEKVGASDGGD